MRGKDGEDRGRGRERERERERDVKMNVVGGVAM
jgi:hypothetical protein